MKVSRRNQDLARFHRVALARFLDRQPAGGVKTLGEQPGEQRRHVLHHQNRQRELGRQLRQDRAQRGRPSRGDSDRHHFGPHLHALRRTGALPRRLAAPLTPVPAPAGLRRGFVPAGGRTV